MSNFGDSELIHGKAPIYALNSSPVAEHAYLRYLSQATAGAYLNLANLTKAEALAKLTSVPYSFLGVKQVGKNITETYPRTAVPIDGSFSLAGMLKGKGAEITLEFGLGGKVLHSEKVTLDYKVHGSDSGLARRIWAQKKIAELELRPNKHEDEITELGKEHSIVTRHTSLIVLDRLEDYVTHRIIPPEPDLRRQYLAKIEQQQKNEDKGRKERIAGVIKKFEQRVAWWNKTFKFGTGKPPRLSKNNENEGGFLSGLRNFFSFGTRTVNDEALEDPEERSADFASGGEFIQNSAPMPHVADLMSISDDSLDVSASTASFGARVEQSKSRDSGPSPAGAIKLKKWNPKTPYLAKLKKAKAGEWYAVYLEQREENEGSSAFFLDVSDFFLEKKQPGLALRILSNVAEMELENPQLLRILGLPAHAESADPSSRSPCSRSPQYARGRTPVLPRPRPRPRRRQATPAGRRPAPPSRGRQMERSLPRDRANRSQRDERHHRNLRKGTRGGQPRQAPAQESARGRPGHPDLGRGQHRHGPLGDRPERGKVLLQSP